MSLLVEAKRVEEPGKYRDFCPEVQHAPFSRECPTGVLDAARPGKCVEPGDSVVLTVDERVRVGAPPVTQPIPNCKKDFPDDPEVFLADGGCAVPLR